MNYAEESLRLHEKWKGKIEVIATVPVATKDDLSLAYTPGVAQPCLEIQKDVNLSYDLTRRHNLCAVITDGSAVLGLGDIGPEAGMHVMEGKCVLFKAFGGVDAFPLCVKTKDVDEFVNAVALISGSFGGINLEDIAAPRCFEIERKLKECCDIPIFHDDQHGTAVITLAGLTNALKVVGKKREDVKIVTSGAGAAAISIEKLLLSAGFINIVMTDRSGAIYEGRENLSWIKQEMALVTIGKKKPASLRMSSVGRMCSLVFRLPVRLRQRWSRPWLPIRLSSLAPIRHRRLCRRRPRPAARPSSPQAVPISPTKSITCWLSPAFSAAPSTSAPPALTRK